LFIFLTHIVLLLLCYIIWELIRSNANNDLKYKIVLF
jgi:hypothetical protein